MNALAGTPALIRLALRLDRVRLPIWVAVLAVMPAATAAQYMKLYPDDQSIRQVAGFLTNPSLVAINGPLFSPTLDGLTTWKILATELVLVALMSLLTVVRHTRTEEETGRLELVRAGTIGRHAPLTAALLVAGAADLAAGLLVAVLLTGAGLAAVGSIALGVAIAVTGLAFTGIAAVAAQLTTSARTATAIGAAVLGAAYLVRALGDAGPSWLPWLSPIGWGLRIRPFGDEQWAVASLGAAGAVVLTAVAYVLAGWRDLGAGLLPQRPGPAEGPPGLRSPFALAWRLHRGMLLGWSIGMLLWGAALGGAAQGLGDTVGANSQITELLTRMGGSKGLVDAYIATVFGITGLVVTAYTVQATLRLRAEEAAGRVEPLLATGVTRVRWLVSHLVFALLGTAVLLIAAGAGAGLAYGGQVGAVSTQLPRLLGAALVQLPATWVLAGLGVALFGLAPRLAPLTWAALIVCVVLLEVGAVLGLSRAFVEASPFAHVPQLPGSAFTATPLLWLTAIAVALSAVGVTAFRRRDIATS